MYVHCLSVKGIQELVQLIYHLIEVEYTPQMEPIGLNYWHPHGISAELEQSTTNRKRVKQ